MMTTAAAPTTALTLTAPALMLATLLSSCAVVKSPYTASPVPLPAHYSQAGASAGLLAQPGSAWWTQFGDPELNRLVAQALARNNNLAVAAIRVRRAQLQAGLAADQLWPKLSGGASVGASRSLDSDALRTRSSSVSIGASYELDLWNKLGSQRDVAQWEALATEQDRQSAALALAGLTARLYWQLGFLNQRLALNADSIAYAQTTFNLVQTQYRAGAVSGLELAEARQTLAAQQASQAQLRQQVVEVRTALGLLFDEPATRLDSNPPTLPNADLPALQAGVPAQLLGRRPDLRAAELRLREAFTGIDATRASYYPAFSLTGSLGSSSVALASVLHNPVAVLGLGLSLPFLQQTAMQLNIRVSQTQYEEAVRNFRQTLYTALGDVENALSGREQLAEQGRRLQEALQAARTAERLYEVRYRAGGATLKNWLDAQEQRRSAEVAWATTQLARLNNQAALYLALGGDAALAAP